MYVPFASACTERNSATPMSVARIEAQNARVRRVSTKFTDGNAVIDRLMAGLTPPLARPSCGDLLSSRGMRAGYRFPELGGGPAPRVEIPTAAEITRAFNTALVYPPDSSGAYPLPKLGDSVRADQAGTDGQRTSTNGGYGTVSGERSGQRPPCTVPEILPLLTVLPLPLPQFPVAAPRRVAPPRPASAPGPVSSVPVPVAAPPATVAAPQVTQASCRTGNLCLDLLNGCVSSTQVTPEQQLACSLAGYAGNRNRYREVAALPNKPWIGTVDLNPPRYNPGMGEIAASPMGSGLSCLATLALGGLAIYGVTRMIRK